MRDKQLVDFALASVILFSPMEGIALQNKMWVLASIFFSFSALGATQNFRWTGGRGESIDFEVLNDRIVRFEFFKDSRSALNLADNSLVPPGEFSGPGIWKKTATGFRTADLSVEVSSKKFCFKVKDLSAKKDLTEICADKAGSFLQLKNPQMTYAYGLGEQFFSDPQASMNWVGRQKTPGNEYGNKMNPFEGGNVGNAQFPMLYALGKGRLNFGLLLDHIFAETWDLRKQPWIIHLKRGPSRGYFFAGPDLPALRENFLSVVGKPLRFPKKSFGLWVSEYGFDNWKEIQSHWETLKASRFPVDGFVMDLQWFGGVSEGSETSPVGALQWDLQQFPDPKAHVQDWKKKGIGLIAVEEPYISRKTVDRKLKRPIHEVLAEKGFLVKESAEKNAKPVQLEEKLWWGLGGMMDFTQEAAADFWHDLKRQDLVETGMMGHWTDLGEPEGFRSTAFYNQGRWSHEEIHNVYNLKWSESIYRGYQRNKVIQRPWILSRSGTVGSQRFGVSMWSGDIGSNFESLRAHLVAQNHLFLVGMDSFGSDIGGFLRKALRGNLNDLYTQWFANAALFEFPIRPHTENLCNCRETAPDRIGNLASNRDNLRLRSQLNPLYYSLGVEAQLKGAAMIVPLVYWFQEDEKTRDLSLEKMIGPHLLGVAVAAEGAKTQNVYLPAGVWFDFRDHKKTESRGQWVHDVSLYRDQKFQLPLYAREGAIFPLADLAEDGTSLPDFVVRVYPSRKASSFEFFEDDGWSNAYLQGQTAVTKIEQVLAGSIIRLKIGATKGSFEGQPERRPSRVEVITSLQPQKIVLNGRELPLSSWEKQGDLLKIQLGSPSKEIEKDIEIR